MNDTDRRILEENGWEIECESPLEISCDYESRATGYAAEIVLAYLKEDYEQDGSSI